MADAVRLLLVREPSGRERIVHLDRPSMTLGRDAECAIRIDSPFVSRVHARIDVGDAGATLVDLGSRNGCTLNGQRVAGAIALSAGDVIAIADVALECAATAEQGATTATFVPPPDEPAGDRLRVDARVHQVWVGERALEPRLSAQEFALLHYLYERSERVCSRQELGDAVWGAHNWEPNMLHRLVHRLKGKLEPDPRAASPRYVHTVPQVGYRVTR